MKSNFLRFEVLAMRSLLLVAGLAMAGCSFTSQARGLLKDIERWKLSADAARTQDDALRAEGEGPYEAAVIEQTEERPTCAEIWGRLYSLSVHCQWEIKAVERDNQMCERSTPTRLGNCLECEEMLELRDGEWAANNCNPNKVKRSR